MKQLYLTVFSLLVLQHAFAKELSPEAIKENKRSFVAVKLVEVKDDGTVLVDVINKTGKDIRDIRGGFEFEDKQGNYIWGTGLTFAANQVFLKKGETKRWPLDNAQGMTIRNGELKGSPVIEGLRKNIDSIKAYFTAEEIVYADGSKEVMVWEQ